MQACKKLVRFPSDHFLGVGIGVWRLLLAISRCTLFLLPVAGINRSIQRMTSANTYIFIFKLITLQWPFRERNVINNSHSSAVLYFGKQGIKKIVATVLLTINSQFCYAWHLKFHTPSHKAKDTIIFLPKTDSATWSR